MPGRFIGSTVAASFGLAFVLINCGQLPGAWPVVARIAGLLAALAYAVLVWRNRAVVGRPGEGGSMFRGWYWPIVIAEAIAIVVGVAVLARVFDRGAYGVAWVITVVGLHFLPLGLASGQLAFVWLAAIVTPVGLVGLALAVVRAPLWWVALLAVATGGFFLASALWAVFRPAAPLVTSARAEGMAG